MKNSYSRREWLKTSLIGSAGLSLSGGLNLINCNSIPQEAGVNSNGVILLDQNENPFGISENAKQAIKDAIIHANRYPEKHVTDLKKLIADKEGVSEDNIVLGAGATEIFRTAALLYCSEGEEVILADPSYFGFVNYTDDVKGEMIKIPLDNELKHNLDAIAQKVSGNTNLVYICNPNNPTGTIVNKNKLNDFCEEMSKTAPVFVDEAYHDFVEDPEYSSMMDHVRKGRNVIIARTFSKIHGFAGLRVGYGIAQPDVIKEFKRIRTNFAPVSVVCLNAAIASYQDTDFTDLCRMKNREAKQYFCTVLDKHGYSYTPSHTNFVLYKINEDAKEYRDKILKHDIKVRPISFHGEHYCRVSIGKMEEMEKLAGAIELII
ncbi:MAG: histidinol-phosphate transaminase [bacterium]|nr:histidinol-phosphate transaminase [bacterium]